MEYMKEPEGLEKKTETTLMEIITTKQNPHNSKVEGIVVTDDVTEVPGGTQSKTGPGSFNWIWENRSGLKTERTE